MAGSQVPGAPRTKFAPCIGPSQRMDEPVRFVAICDQYSSGLLKELYYLFKIDCPKLLAGKWAQGVQLSRIAPTTRIVVNGRTATVYDGRLPDRAVYVLGRWTLLESPRNHLSSRSNETLETAKELNPASASARTRFRNARSW